MCRGKGDGGRRCRSSDNAARRAAYAAKKAAERAAAAPEAEVKAPQAAAAAAAEYLAGERAKFAHVADLYPVDPNTASYEEAEEIEEEARRALRAHQMSRSDYGVNMWTLPVGRTDAEREADRLHGEEEKRLRDFKRWCERVASAAFEREGRKAS